METKKLSEKFNKIIFTTVIVMVYALAIFMVAYLVYNAIDANYSSVKTEIATMKTVEKTINSKVFVVRDETYISGKAAGTVVPLVEEGQRVAEGQDIAAVFANDSDAEKYVELQKINKELVRFENIAAADKLNIRDMSSYEATTNEKFLSLVEALSEGDYSSVSELAYSVRDRETSRQVSLGYDVDTSAVLAELRSESASLSSVVPDYLAADNTGYYISNSDGYEKTLNYAEVTKLTTSDIDKAIESKPDESKISGAGKLINNFNWYVVASVERNDIDELTVGKSVKVRFVDSSADDVRMTVAAINSDSKGKAALILRCNTITPGTGDMRIENAEIILETISGYKIPKEAMRTLDGVNGVYIKRGNLVNFRRITVLYTGDDYVISRTYEAENANYENEMDEIDAENRIYTAQLSVRYREEPSWIIECEDIHSRSKLLEKSYIKLYDEVIVEGNGLYDSKIV
ncbi:MAG: hypothetical protein IKL16_02710 [Clostridia bacterium]|nr:hypothetical protein [Clostridia bacterium]